MERDVNRLLEKYRFELATVLGKYTLRTVWNNGKNVCKVNLACKVGSVCIIEQIGTNRRLC